MRPPDSAPFAFAVVILAAGASSRMGRPKMLLPWGETTVLGCLVAQWQQTGARQITVVVAANDSGITNELDRIGFPREQRITNPDPARGMFSSIQAAARWHGWWSTPKRSAWRVDSFQRSASATRTSSLDLA